MAERPILFQGAMVRAILAGTKTQTRRAVKGNALEWLQPEMFTPEYVAMPENRLCPYGVPGDRLWVRESCMTCEPADGRERRHVTYRADPAYGRLPEDIGHWECKVRPSIHMPRWACRLVLEITAVRVERLQDISEADAWAEGCVRGLPDDIGGFFPAEEPDPSGIGMRGWDNAVDWYADLWEQINGPGSWEANPWVWAVEFQRVQPC